MGEVVVGLSAAEREIRRWPTDTLPGIVAWGQHVAGATFKVHQPVLIYLIRLFRNVLGVDSPRTGKSWSFCFAGLIDCAVHPSEDLRIYAPAKHQAKNDIFEILKHIDRPLPQGGHNPLWHFIRRRGGKRQLLAESFEFQNESNAKIFGERSQIDSENATILHLDEFDDMNPEIVSSRIMTRGLATNPNGQPTRLRYTGVIHGKENLHAIETDPKSFALSWPNGSWKAWGAEVARLFERWEPHAYRAAVLPKLTAPVAVEMGILDRHATEAMREASSDEAWRRLGLCEYVEARNFIPEADLRSMMKAGQVADPPLAMIEPLAGGRHEKVGRIALGLDVAGKGKGAEASKHACVVLEQVGPVRFFRYAEEWGAQVGPEAVIEKIVALWDYFRPNVARGDAFGADLIRRLGERLAEEGLTSKNPKLWPADTESSWERWPVKPVRFTGQAKHLMFTGLRTALAARAYAAPYVGWRPESRRAFVDPASGDRALAKAAAQASNIRAETGQTYYLFRPIARWMGDDLLDAWVLADSALGTTRKSEPGMMWIG